MDRESFVMLEEVFRGETRKEVTEGFLVKRLHVGIAIVAFVNAAKVEAQAAQNGGGVEERGSDIGELRQTQEFFMKQDVPIEESGNSSPLSFVGERFQKREETAREGKLMKAIDEGIDSGKDGIHLPPRQRVTNDLRVFVTENDEIAGRFLPHETIFARGDKHPSDLKKNSKLFLRRSPRVVVATSGKGNTRRGEGSFPTAGGGPPNPEGIALLKTTLLLSEQGSRSPSTVATGIVS